MSELFFHSFTRVELGKLDEKMDSPYFFFQEVNRLKHLLSCPLQSSRAYRNPLSLFSKKKSQWLTLSLMNEVKLLRIELTLPELSTRLIILSLPVKQLIPFPD